ncbi:MAG: hypothetical protein ACKORY_07200 [Actinomycetota bacterium]
MDDRWRASDGSAADRLASLRDAAPRERDATRSLPRKGLTREILLGVVLLLAGVLIGLTFLLRGNEPATSGTMPIGTPVGAVTDLGEGEFLVAALVEPGSFPPALEPGMKVRVIVSSAIAMDDPPRLLPGAATVRSVDGAGELTSSTVITLRAETDVAREVAAAETVRLLVVGGGE